MQFNYAHLHLILNHIPVIGSMAASLLLLCGMFGKSRALVTAGLAGMILVALAALPVTNSGEAAEEMVEEQPHVSHDYIEQHEEAAERAFYFALLAGAGALGLLFTGRRRESYPVWAALTGLLLSSATLALMTIAASYGGKISHPEIREDGLLPWAGSWMPSGGEPESAGEEDSGRGRHQGRGGD